MAPMTSRRVSRFIGASKASFVICALGMVAVSALALYIAAFDPLGDTYVYGSYEGVGWVAGPVGILFFGYCAWRGLKSKTDGEGRILTPEGKPLGEE